MKNKNKSLKIHRHIHWPQHQPCLKHNGCIKFFISWKNNFFEIKQNNHCYTEQNNEHKNYPLQQQRKGSALQCQTCSTIILCDIKSQITGWKCSHGESMLVEVTPRKECKQVRAWPFSSKKVFGRMHGVTPCMRLTLAGVALPGQFAQLLQALLRKFPA